MAPKNTRAKTLGVIPGCGLSLEERRALRGIGQPIASNGPWAAAARGSLPAPVAAVEAPVNVKRNAGTLGGTSLVVNRKPLLDLRISTIVFSDFLFIHASSIRYAHY